MNLYLIKQTENPGYDTYRSAVVVANSEEDAKKIHPNGRDTAEDWWSTSTSKWYDGWAHPDNVKVELIGIAADHLQPNQVVCCIFRHG